MKKSTKKKYETIKPDGSGYTELVSEYEREQMHDYSFKSAAKAMGKNAKRLKRMQMLRAVIAVLGAVIVLYFGYFIIAVIKGVNSRPQTTTAQYVEIVEQESTTVPTTEEDTSTTGSSEEDTAL